jgi:hypothetical protein
MELTEKQKMWSKKRRQGASSKMLEEILIKQKGKCALSDADLVFDVTEGTPQKGGNGCHPCYPAVDHIDPGNPNGGYQIVCYALNDLKGHLPTDCFKALIKTKAWKTLMKSWRKQAKTNIADREAFKKLIRPNANQ